MKQVVKVTLSHGKRIHARLIKENNKTVIVEPYKWIETKQITLKKKQAQMEYTGESI
jgi:hypothetical protein